MLKLKHTSYSVLALLFTIMAMPSYTLGLGDKLTPLHIASTPVNFNYQPSGKPQLILIYPLAFSSRSSGKFNHRVIEAGFCPKSIVDMKNKAWYAPVSLAEKEMAKRVKESPNPNCTVTADYNGQANKHWGLEKGPTSIVTNGAGKVVFFNYGVLDEAQQLTVISLLAEKPEQLARAK